MFLLALSASLVVGAAWADPEMNPGKWEITTKTEMAGMPSQTFTHTECLTDEDMVPKGHDENQKCEITDVKTIGNTVLWKINCGKPGSPDHMEGTGQITYQGDTMQGFMEISLPGYNAQMKSTLFGRRIGSCDDEAASTTGQSSETTADGSDSSVGDALAEDAKDMGKAAKDEAKQGTIDEIRKGVRGAIEGLFD